MSFVILHFYPQYELYYTIHSTLLLVFILIRDRVILYRQWVLDINQGLLCGFLSYIPYNSLIKPPYKLGIVVNSATTTNTTTTTLLLVLLSPHY